MVAKADFFDARLDDPPASAAGLKDGLHYRLIISASGRRAAQLSDFTAPADFRPLLRLLQQMAAAGERT
jgi:hypothetical protein